MSRIKQLGRDSLIYGLGGVFGRGIGILLMPIYTRIFTPADYGTIEMLNTIAGLLAAVMIMGMDSAQSFFFYEQKVNGQIKQAQVVSSIFRWRLIWGAICVVAGMLLAPILNASLFEGRLHWYYFLLAFSSLFFYQIMSQSSELFRLLYQPWSYVLLTITQSVIAAAVVLVAVIKFRLGILGFFIGGSMAAALVACLGWWRGRAYLTWDSHWRTWWPRLLRFGWPLLPSGLAYYVMSMADRWFIQRFNGADELGIYSVAAKLGLAMSFAVETFRQAWWPMAMDAMHSDDGPETFRMISRLYMGAGVSAVLYVTFLAPWLIRWLAAPVFQRSYLIVGLMAWQALFYGYYMIVAAGIWKSQNTILTVWLMGGAAVLNLLLNWLLVPQLGGQGAALSTAITFFIWIVASYFVSERFWPIRLPLYLLTAIVSIGMAGHALLLWLQAKGEWVSTVILTHGLIVVVILISVDKNHRSKLINKFRSRVKCQN